jgi:hypothetical protein
LGHDVSINKEGKRGSGAAMGAILTDRPALPPFPAKKLRGGNMNLARMRRGVADWHKCCNSHNGFVSIATEYARMVSQAGHKKARRGCT